MGILILAFRTKFDYVYLVWFFIINDAPGRLFSGSALDDLRVPLYTLTSGTSVSFQELFLFLYLFKYLCLRKHPGFIFKKEFGWFLTFGLFTAGWSFLLGMSFDNVVRTFRIFLPWSLIFILPSFISNKTLLLRSTQLIFPMIILALVSQIYTYFTGYSFDGHLRGLEAFNLGVYDKGFALRAHSAVYITFFSIIQACYYFFNRNSGINANYAGIVIFSGFFSIFLTATRGWIVALIILLLLMLLLMGSSRYVIKWIRLATLSVIAFLIVGSHLPMVQKQIDATLQRLSMRAITIIHGQASKINKGVARR